MGCGRRQRREEAAVGNAHAEAVLRRVVMPMVLCCHKDERVGVEFNERAAIRYEPVFAATTVPACERDAPRFRCYADSVAHRYANDSASNARQRANCSVWNEGACLMPPMPLDPFMPAAAIFRRRRARRATSCHPPVCLFRDREMALLIR